MADVAPPPLPPGSHGAYSAFSKGDLIWYDQGEYPIPAEVIDVDPQAKTARIRPNVQGDESMIVANFGQLQTRPYPDPNLVAADDLVQINDLSDGNLLWTIKNRFEQGKIYTYVGGILLAVNPRTGNAFDSYYGPEVIQRYCNRILGSLPPHIFAIAEAAYAKMRSTGHDQVLIPSGESGSGKTETCKHLLRYLTSAAPCSRGRMEPGRKNITVDQIMAAMPILESFANAGTALNDNSTRCGITVDLGFKHGTICGAEYTEYVLEKNRVVSHNNGERNFHVFYELLAGLKPELKDKFGLSNAEKYFYLNQGKNMDLPTRNDKESFRILQTSLDILGLGGDQKHSIFRILAAILHIGNVYFNRQQNQQNQETVTIGNEAEVQWISYLLQLDADSLKLLLTTKSTESREQRAASPLNIDKALDVRDSIAKALYTQLFAWLVNRINQSVRKSGKEANITVVDLFGFENLRTNSYEQLCVNYSNERLHAYFVESMFRAEQNEYAREKIVWQEKIGSHLNNQPVLDLLSRRPSGVFHLLDDECSFPKGTDESFLQKCHYSHVDNALYGKPRMHNPEFCVKHYAGSVWYDASGFLDKNRDVLKTSVVDVLVESQNSMISQMFKNWKNAQQTVVKPKMPSAMVTFADGLNQLMKKVVKGDPHFVRCIKSNNDKSSAKFEMSVVVKQLRNLGVGETVRIRKLGYPIRFKFSNFIARYRSLASKDILVDTGEREACNRLLTTVTPHLLHMCQIGATKVFMKDMLCEVLEHTRERRLQSAAIKIQKNARAFVQRRRYKQQRASAVKIQAIVRGWIARNQYRRMKRSVMRDAEQQAKRCRQLQMYEKMRQEAAAVDDPTDDKRHKNFSIAGVHHLDMPHDLGAILDSMPEWDRRNRQERVARAAQSEVALLANQDTGARFTLPPDLHAYPFSKFVQANFKSHVWQMRREPVATPFLPKENDADFQDSLVIFKLILRYMNDVTLSPTQECMLANYIVQKGLSKTQLRDEIYAQLVNQTYSNPNPANQERGWWLIGLCASTFPPSPHMYKYVLNYIVHSDCNGYKLTLQNRLAQSAHSEAASTRRYPPSLVEHKAMQEKAKMALPVTMADGVRKKCQMESWTTAGEFAQTILKEKGLDDTRGWTVSFVSPEVDIRLNGNDYILDVVSYFELPNTFPALKSEFLVAPRSNASKYGSWTKEKSTSKKQPEPMTGSQLNKRYMDNGQAGPHASAFRPLTPHNRQPEQQHRMDSTSSSPVSDPRQDTPPSNAQLQQRNAPVAAPAAEMRQVPMQREQPAQHQAKPSLEQQLQMEIQSRTLGRGGQQQQQHRASTPHGAPSGAMAAQGRVAQRDQGTFGSSTMRKEIPEVVMPSHGGEDAGYSRAANHAGPSRPRVAPSEYSMRSMASHVRNVAIPSKNSDVDKFLDELFEPVLHDSTMEDIYDLRSIAASIKGMGDNYNGNNSGTLTRQQVVPRAPMQNAASMQPMQQVQVQQQQQPMMLTTAQMMPSFLPQVNQPVIMMMPMDSMRMFNMNGAPSTGTPSESQFSTMNTDWSSVASQHNGQNQSDYYQQHRYQPQQPMLPAVDYQQQAPGANGTLAPQRKMSAPQLHQQPQQQQHNQPQYQQTPMPYQQQYQQQITYQQQPAYQTAYQTYHHQPHQSSVAYHQQLQLSPVPQGATVYAPAMLSPTASTITAITAPVMPLQVSTFVPMSVTALASPVLTMQQQQPLSPYGTLSNQYQQHKTTTMLSPSGVPPEPSYPAPNMPNGASGKAPSHQAPEPPAVVHIPPDRAHPMSRHFSPPPQAPPMQQQGGNTKKPGGQMSAYQYEDDYAPPQHLLQQQQQQQQYTLGRRQPPRAMPQQQQQPQRAPMVMYGGNSTMTGASSITAEEYDDYDDDSTVVSGTTYGASYGGPEMTYGSRRGRGRFGKSGPPTTITEEASDESDAFDRHGTNLMVGKMKPSMTPARYVGSVQIGGGMQPVQSHPAARPGPGHTIGDLAKEARKDRRSSPHHRETSMSPPPVAPGVIPAAVLPPQPRSQAPTMMMPPQDRDTVSPPAHRLPTFRPNDDRKRQEAMALEKMKANSKLLPPPVDQARLIRPQREREGGDRYDQGDRSIDRNRYAADQSMDRNRYDQSIDHSPDRYPTQSPPQHDTDGYSDEDRGESPVRGKPPPRSNNNDQSTVQHRVQQLETKRREAIARAQQHESFGAAEREWTQQMMAKSKQEFDPDEEPIGQDRSGMLLHQHGDQFDRYAFSKTGNNRKYQAQAIDQAAHHQQHQQQHTQQQTRLDGAMMEEDRFGDWVHESVNLPPYRNVGHGGRSYGYEDGDEAGDHQRPLDLQTAVNDAHIWNQEGGPKQTSTDTILRAPIATKDPRRKGPLLTYEDAPWSFHLQKELFFPNESLDNAELLDLVFYQIVRDIYDWNPFRIRKDERESMLATLRYQDIDPQSMQSSKVPAGLKRSVVDTARTWPLYFCRFYHIVEDRKSEYVAQMLSVSETGLRLIVRSYASPEEPLKVLDHLEYEDIDRVEVSEPNLLVIITFNKLHVRLFTERAESIKALIDEFLYGPNQGKQYVRACADYITKEANLLSFKKGDIIQLVTNMQENYMGSGWLYGKFNNRFGNFPSNYVESFSGDVQLNREAQSADDMMMMMMPEDPMHEAMMFTNGSMPRQGRGKMTMMEFAMQHYKNAPSGGRIEDGEIKTPKKSKKEWTWKEFADMVKFSKSPIQSSLLKLDKGEVNKLAVECFVNIMTYMGDYPLKKDASMVDCIYKLLMACHNHPQMRDEVYCQVVKQTTNNKSTKPDSAILGWRLFSILTAYFDCSDVLKPYLVKYLSEAASDTRRAYHGTAGICLQNMRQTFKYGGRKYLLSAREIESITTGKNLKRQVYHLPGGTKKVVNTKSITVVEEVIQELCQELNIRSPLEQQEFCLCYVVEADNTMKLMANDEYILDVTTELEFKRKDYFLLLKRTVWIHPLRLDNDLYIDVMFFQVVPDYLEGLLVIMRSPETISASFMDDIARLGALLHCADDHWDGQYVNSRSVAQLLPRIVQNLRHINLEQWAERVNAKLRQLSPKISTTQARAKFLEVLQGWQLFGSTFFYILNVTDPRVQGECLMSINKHGVQFLHMITHETLLEFRLSEILSTHRVNAPHPAAGAPIQFLDMKVGNLLQQRVISLQTDQSSEISRLLGQYIYVDSQNRGFINGNQQNGNSS